MTTDVGFCALPPASTTIFTDSTRLDSLVAANFERDVADLHVLVCAMSVMGGTRLRKPDLAAGRLGFGGAIAPRCTSPGVEASYELLPSV